MLRVALICTMSLVLAVAAPVSEDGSATILVEENNIDEHGNYEFRYETSNGLKRHETGRLVNVGQADEHMTVTGEYSFVDPDGIEHIVLYEADENGYRIISRPPVTIVAGVPGPLVASLIG